MGKAGLEPARVAPHDPKSCSSANSDTPPRSKSRLTVNQLFSEQLLDAFLKSRRQGISANTLTFYHNQLKKFIGCPMTSEGINRFLSHLQCGNGKHAYYRALRSLFKWLHREKYLEDNPIDRVDPPVIARKILPAVTEEEVEILLDYAETLREQCIVSLLFDSGLRLRELCSLKVKDFDFDNLTLKVIVKGNRQAKAAYGRRTADLLQSYIETRDNHDTLFGVGPTGLREILRQLSLRTGIQCNAHAFRRGFACHLHKKGLSTLSIMHLGRWNSMDMVGRYCRSITFDDCLVHYRQLERI